MSKVAQDHSDLANISSQSAARLLTVLHRTMTKTILWLLEALLNKTRPDSGNGPYNAVFHLLCRTYTAKQKGAKPPSYGCHRSRSTNNTHRTALALPDNSPRIPFTYQEESSRRMAANRCQQTSTRDSCRRIRMRLCQECLNPACSFLRHCTWVCHRSSLKHS